METDIYVYWILAAIDCWTICDSVLRDNSLKDPWNMFRIQDKFATYHIMWSMYHLNIQMDYEKIT